MGAKFGKNYKYEPKNHYFRIIKIGHVSEASVTHPYQNIRESGKLPPPPHTHTHTHYTIPAEKRLLFFQLSLNPKWSESFQSTL